MIVPPNSYLGGGNLVSDVPEKGYADVIKKQTSTKRLFKFADCLWTVARESCEKCFTI
jgi:hypothetical protein